MAIRDERVIGLAELEGDPEKTGDFVADSEAELTAIPVRHTHWNDRVGAQFLDEAVDILPAGISGALGVLAGNERARAFSEGRGFGQTGTTVTSHGGEEFSEVVYRRPLWPGRGGNPHN